MSLFEDYPYLKILKDLARKKKRRLHLVGGFLRDHFLGRERADFDFAVDKGAIGFARAFAKKIKGAFVLLDEDNGCARVVKKKKGAPQTFDFADYRAKTLSGDLKKRDFTVNTFALNVKTYTDAKPLEDQLEKNLPARRDLKAQRIRMVSAKAFRDDPLRIIRAYALKANLGFGIERGTLKKIREERERIHDVSMERVRDEFFKILKSSRAAEVIQMMDRHKVLEEVIPQITVMYGCKQGRYHHLDVWPHSLETLVQLDKVIDEEGEDTEIREYLDEPLAGERNRAALMKLAALLHDIGKPETRKYENGKHSFHGHERVGKNIVRPVAKMLKLSTRERRILEDMVMFHLRPGYLSNFKKPSERMIFRYFRDTGEEAASILLLSLADQRATRGPMTSEEDQKHHENICLSLVERFFQKRKEKPFVRLIDGNDLIRALKLKPSPLFSKILSEVEEKQTLGKVKTKKEALELARKISKRQ